MAVSFLSWTHHIINILVDEGNKNLYYERAIEMPQPRPSNQMTQNLQGRTRELTPKSCHLTLHTEVMAHMNLQTHTDKHIQINIICIKLNTSLPV